MKKVKVKVIAEGIVADHIANRLDGQIGNRRDRKDLAQLVIQDDKDPQIEVIESEDA